jgi:hypothetical protein
MTFSFCFEPFLIKRTYIQKKNMLIASLISWLNWKYVYHHDYIFFEIHVNGIVKKLYMNEMNELLKESLN